MSSENEELTACILEARMKSLVSVIKRRVASALVELSTSSLIPVSIVRFRLDRGFFD